MNKILLTGATGFLGSHIMASLLRRGERLEISGRASGGVPLEVRINRLLRWFEIEDYRDKIDIYETDLSKPELGLDSEKYDRLSSETGIVIHCASDTSFAEKNRSRVMKSNVETIPMLLDFASRCKLSFFHYISTAYASGTDRVGITEAPVNSENFINVYEESKAKAEHLVSSFCGDRSIPYTISRPSIVFGDSVTGRSLRFNALYYPVKALKYIRDIYSDDIEYNSGVKSAEAGIFIRADGIMNLPIRIYLPNEGRINLIPVDYFTTAFISIAENPSPSCIYHITSQSPVSMTKLAEFTGRFLKISGLEVICGADNKKELRNPAEEIFDHFIEAYRPYLSDRREFDRSNTDAATGNAVPPELDYEIFEKCMSYAVEMEWGKGLF